MISLILCAAPLCAGAVGAAACLVGRRFVRRWLAVNHLASFIFALGLGAGLATGAMHLRGYRLRPLDALYEAPERHFRRAMDRHRVESQLAERARRGSNDARGERTGG